MENVSIINANKWEKATKRNEKKEIIKCWMFAHVGIELVYNSFEWKAQLKYGMKT